MIKPRIVRVPVPPVSKCPKGSRLVPLSNGKFALVDACDFDLVMQFNWSQVKGYAQTHRFGQMQRFLTLFVAGDNLIDHINGDKLDNRSRNLRPATQQHNAQNSRKVSYRVQPDGTPRSCTSPFKGLSWHKQICKWYAAIQTAPGKRIRLGYSHDPVMLARRYDEAALHHFGEFACTNKMLGLLD